MKLPPGEYAIKLFHDEDNSGVLKKGFGGRPKEGVGFSNNPQLGNRLPSYESVKFNFQRGKMMMIIRMINP